MVKGILKKGLYFDSITLMILSKELGKINGILAASAVMGTKANKSILLSAGIFPELFTDADETDVLIGVKAVSVEIADQALQQIDRMINELRNEQESGTENKVYNFEAAIKQLPEANLSLISVAGRYAAAEAMKALKKGLHVMIFSDNVEIEKEIELKKFAHENDLLLMGPDCGTAIINGVPLGFANHVHRGSVGIVSASGTGLQEVSSVISNNGAGISQAIGTGGRDIRKEVGGIMFVDAMRSLNNDKETKVIVLISKPPHETVLLKLSEEIRKLSKPAVAIFIGGDPDILRKTGAISASTLEEAGLIAVSLVNGKDVASVKSALENRTPIIKGRSAEIVKEARGKYLRGLFSGGTLCDEAQLILKDIIGNVYSNSPFEEKCRLKDNLKSQENTIVDLGDDEFTYGRPHPMIDFSLRNQRILEEASNPDVAVILLDVVLGYGSHEDPASELVPVINQARNKSGTIIFIGSVTGTDKDPQNRNKVIHELEEAGMIIMPSNAAASELAGQVIHQLNLTQK